MFGLVFLVMTAVAVLAVLVPLARRRTAIQGGEAEVYRDQLKEIERDQVQGAIRAEEAEAARTEVARRLIAASEQTSPQATVSVFRRRAVAVLAIAVLPLLAAGFYLAIGHPDLPDQPLAARMSQEDRSLAALVTQVEAELARRPEDGQGWDVVAPVYLRTGQSEKAAKAYANAIRLLGASADREAGAGEAQVFLAEGKVTPEAKAAFERAVALDPKHARARFYLGRASEQANDRAGAADIYRALLADAPAGASYAASVREALARTALGEEGQGPAVDPKQLEGVSPDQRLATIRGMVEGLATRLKDNPRDIGGQLRLVRAWTMLGEQQKAKAAADEARKAFADDPAAQRRIADLLLGLGLEDKPA